MTVKSLGKPMNRLSFRFRNILFLVLNRFSSKWNIKNFSTRATKALRQNDSENLFGHMFFPTKVDT